LGLGVAAMWLVPSIERKTSVFRLVWIMMFLGGMGRVISMIPVGIPPSLFVLFVVIEIVGAPTLIYWQYRLGQTA